MATEDETTAGDAPRLEVLKALGDNTRYAIYLEVARAPRPLTTSEVADTLELHPNTVRPHLERMRDVGLIEVSTASTGAVGRPQHRYALAAGAPSLGLEPPSYPLLTRTLLEAAAASEVDEEDLVRAGRAEGREQAARYAGAPDAFDALEHHLDELGFDPARADDGGTVTIAFTHCPFREMAESHPELVCNLHRGLVEGFAGDACGLDVLSFHSLVDRTPCQVTIAAP